MPGPGRRGSDPTAVYSARVIALLMNTLSLLTVPARAGCDPVALEQALDAADQAFVASDEPAMSSAVKAIRKSVGCIDGPVPPGTCARVHRARALAAWIDGDEDQAVSWLRGMIHADPGIELPTGVVGDRHRLRVLLVAAQEHPIAWMEGPGKHWLLVDGLRTGAVPVGQPYVLQPVRDDGQPQRAKIVDRWRSDAGRPRAVGRTAPGSSTSSAQRAMRWTGLGLGAVSVGLYGGAWAANGAYQGAIEQRDDARIGRLHTTTNALSIGSVAAIGLGAGALLSAEFAF
jgi:hypothetical protein